MLQAGKPNHITIYQLYLPATNIPGIDGEDGGGIQFDIGEWIRLLLIIPALFGGFIYCYCRRAHYMRRSSVSRSIFIQLDKWFPCCDCVPAEMRGNDPAGWGQAGPGVVHNQAAVVMGPDGTYPPVQYPPVAYPPAQYPPVATQAGMQGSYPPPPAPYTTYPPSNYPPPPPASSTNLPPLPSYEAVTSQPPTRSGSWFGRVARP